MPIVADDEWIIAVIIAAMSTRRSVASGLAETVDSRTQTAESTDDQIDHRRVLELIHLGDDARRPPRALVFGLARDEIEEARPHRVRRHQERA